MGRAAELELFRSAIEVRAPPFALLHIHVPGGVGKTALLHGFSYLCAQAGVAALCIEAGTIEPLPGTFVATLQMALGLVQDELPEAELAPQPVRLVLLIDAYEALAPLDSWMRDVLLPELSERVLVVPAGRQPPAAAWRVDSGWRNLRHTISLRNLSPDESIACLGQHGIPQEHHSAVLALTRGHPLALVVIPARPAAVNSCAIVRVTTGALLADGYDQLTCRDGAMVDGLVCNSRALPSLLPEGGGTPQESRTPDGQMVIAKDDPYPPEGRIAIDEGAETTDSRGLCCPLWPMT